jgi:hypothetical protein
MRSQNSIDGADSGGVRILDIRQITTDQLAQLGVSRLAYIKPVTVGGEDVFAIHAADGTPMAVAPNRELATELVPGTAIGGPSGRRPYFASARLG